MADIRAAMMAFYSRASDKSNNDIILVKERIKDNDGNETNNVRFIENYTRSFFTTKKHHQPTHQFKKEYETLENLNEHFTTQAKMAPAIAKALNIRSGWPRMGELKKSPYLYGSDISTSSLVKQQYLDKFPSYAPAATVATLDLETNVFSERGEIVYGCITFKDKALLVTTQDFIGDIPQPEEQLKKLFTQYLGKYEEERHIKLHVRVVKDDLALVKLLMGSMHALKPDFMSIWNMSFDIPKILECLEHYNVDPKDIFCDPAVPSIYRKFNWRQDQLQKTTATGKVTSKHVADLWHVADTMASFYIIDAMCFFKRNRVRETARHSYSLDAILGEELKLGKLRFKEADMYSGLEWHQYMQVHHKLEYGIYNIFDCLALELLDEKTGDLSKAVLAGVGITDLANLASGPRNLANDMHMFLKERGKIITSTSPNMTEELDSEVLGMKDWIVTAASELIADTDNAFISDMEGLESRLYTNTFDVDIASGYPTTEVIMNVSKETTCREVCAIEGMSEEEQRRLGVNLTATRTNAIDLGQGFYGLPKLDALLQGFTQGI